MTSETAMTSVAVTRRSAAATALALLCAAAVPAVTGCGSTGPEPAPRTTSTHSTHAAAPFRPFLPRMPRSEGLGFGTYGGLSLGMTRDQVRADGYRIGVEASGDGCVGGPAVTPDGKTITLGFTADDRVLSVIGAPAGEGTLAVREAPASAAQVRRAYPRARFVVVPAHGTRPAAVEVSRPGRHGKLYFQLAPDGRLTAPRTALDAAARCL